MNAVWTVMAKEVVDGLRDRRALLSALLFPLSCAAMVVGLLYAIGNRDPGDEARVAVQGAEHAPALLAALEEAGLSLAEAPDDAEEAVASGSLDVVVRIPAGAMELLAEGRSVPVELVRDRSKAEASATASRVERALGTWSAREASLRLLARGLSPELVQPLRMQEVDLSTPGSRAGSVLEMVTLFVVLAAFFCNMYVAIDATAGERERRSLEPLLLNPVRAELLVVGKWLATVVFGAAGVLLTVLLLALALPLVSLEELGMRVVLGPAEVLGVLALTLPLALLAGAIQLLVSTFAGSFKEAQIYVSLVMMLPMVPGLVMALRPMETAAWMAWVPLLGQQVLVTDLLSGTPPSLAWQLALSGVTLLVAMGALLLTALLYRRERTVLGA